MDGATETKRVSFHFTIEATEELEKLGHHDTTAISGTLHYIKPRHALKNLDKEVFRKLSTDITSWFVKHFGHYSLEQAEFVEEMVDHVVTYTMYTYPCASTYEKLLLHGILHCWWWMVGDWLDTAKFECPTEIMTVLVDVISKPVPPRRSSMDMDPNNYEEEELVTGTDSDHAVLKNFISAYQDFYRRVELVVPQFPEKAQRFSYLMKKRYQAVEWALVDNQCFSYSDPTFKTLRSLEGGLECTYELLMILEDVKSSLSDIWDHPMFHMLLTLSANINVNVNDVLGLKKDAITGDMDSWVVYKIKEQFLAANKAVRDVVQNTNELVDDFVDLRDKVLIRFSEKREFLLNFLDILESHEFGSFQLYAVSPRYLMGGRITVEE